MTARLLAGIILAALLFMKQMADMTHASEITENKQAMPYPLPQGWRAFHISGSLFFAAADKVFGELILYCQPGKGLILHLNAVNMLDAGGISALNKLIEHCEKIQTRILLSELQEQPLLTLKHHHIEEHCGALQIYPTLEEACAAAADQRK